MQWARPSFGVVAALADSQTGVLPRTRAVCCSAIKGTWSPSPVADPQKSGLNTSVRTCLVQITAVRGKLREVGVSGWLSEG
jgi:hypothetical protein